MRNSLTAKNGPKTGLFGRKTRSAREKKDIVFRVFFVFRDFATCKALLANNLQGSGPSPKNRAQKPTIGFWVFAGFGNVFA
jgi:hypothetical protein